MSKIKNGDQRPTQDNGCLRHEKDPGTLKGRWCLPRDKTKLSGGKLCWWTFFFYWMFVKIFGLSIVSNCGAGKDSWESLGLLISFRTDWFDLKPVSPKGNQPWIFIGRTNAEAVAPILWPLDVKSQQVGKDPGVGKDGWQVEKGVTENEMIR